LIGLAEPAYHIKYAESADGILLGQKGIVAIDYIDGKPSGISRPSVVKESRRHLLYVGIRGVRFQRADAAESYKLATQRLLMV
jgi:hypothetical protein